MCHLIVALPLTYSILEEANTDLTEAEPELTALKQEL